VIHPFIDSPAGAVGVWQLVGRAGSANRSNGVDGEGVGLLDDVAVRIEDSLRSVARLEQKGPVSLRGGTVVAVGVAVVDFDHTRRRIDDSGQTGLVAIKDPAVAENDLLAAAGGKSTAGRGVVDRGVRYVGVLRHYSAAEESKLPELIEGLISIDTH